jgi:zinc protease
VSGSAVVARGAIVLLCAVASGHAQIRLIAKPSKSPLVSFRIVFSAGSAADPGDKPGLANLTAMLIAEGGTKDLTQKQIADAMFPMAAGFASQVDKEMTTFSGTVHSDNLLDYYKLLRARLLDPGWREDDFRRVKEDAINDIKVGLRNNDEELAKEVLYHEIHQGTPYGSYSQGTVKSIEKITLEDVQRFYRMQYSLSNLYLGIAGGYPQSFTDTLKKDFMRLPESAGFRPRPKHPSLIGNSRVVIVEKDTRSVAISLGFPILVTRSRPDYAALLVATSYFGQHRMSGGVLYNELREKRGLNYGNYAYIEYFPQGMYLMEPSPNLARQSQIFQIWIRPVEPPNAKFALRMALYQLDKLIREGIPPEAFERTRDFLTRYVNFLTRTQRAELGYAIDSIWYSTSTYSDSVKNALARLTVADVNRAIKSHLRTNRVVIAAVAKDAEALKNQLASDGPSPMTYNSAKPDAIIEVDGIVEKWQLHLRAEDIKIVPVGDVFANGPEIDSSRDPRGR